MKNLIVFFVCLWSCLFQGENVNAQPETISYSGYLEHQGEPFSTLAPGVNLALFLVPQRDFQVPNNPQEWVVNDNSNYWGEVHPAVQVHHGNFTVELGSVTPFQTGLFSREGFLYVGFMIQLIEGGEWIELGGRQKLLAAPNAISAKEALDFTVRQNLDVRGRADIGGTTVIDERGISVVGHESDENGAYTLRLEDDGSVMLFDGNDINTNGTLKIQDHQRNPTVIYGDLTLEQNAQVDQNLTVNGNTFLNNTTVRGDLHVDGNITNFGLSREYSEYSDNRRNDVENRRPGDQIEDLGPSENRFCFLTEVQFSELDDAAEVGVCRIYADNNRWYLQSTQISDSFSYCKARCFSW